MNALISAARPKTLFAGVSPVIFGLSYAYYINQVLEYDIAIITVLCAMCLQISSNLINDYYDGIKGTDTQERLGPKRAISSGLMSVQEMKKYIVLFMGIAFFMGSFLMFKGGLLIIIIGLSSMLFSYLYTGGPFPLSYFGLGEILAFIFFGPVAVIGTYYLQTKSISPEVYIIGSIPGLYSAIIMSVNNLRDIYNDKKVHKKTLAVLIGEKNFRFFIAFLILAILINIVFLYKYTNNIKHLSLIIPLIIFAKNWNNILFSSIGAHLNKNLAMTGGCLFASSLAFLFSSL